MEADRVDVGMGDFLGCRVRKHFRGHGYFLGHVVSYHYVRKLFRVIYEDGDQEEVDLSELQECLWDTTLDTNSKAEEKKRTRKRGKSGRKVAAMKVSKKARVQVNTDAPLQGSKLVPQVQDRVCLSIRKHFKTLVGSTVRKFFKGHGDYDGTVVAYHSRDRFFTVEYVDGDLEELDWEELKEILVDISNRKLTREMLQIDDNDQAAQTGDVDMPNPPEVTADETGAVVNDDFEKKVEEEAGPKASGYKASISSDEESGHITGAEGTAGANQATQAKSKSYGAVDTDALIHELDTHSPGEVKVGQQNGETEDMYTGARNYYDGIVVFLNAETELGSHPPRRQVSWADDVADNEDDGDSEVSTLGAREDAGARGTNQGKRSSVKRSGGKSRVRGAHDKSNKIRQEMDFPAAAAYESPAQSVREYAEHKPQTVKRRRPRSSSDDQAVFGKPRDHCNRRLVGRTVSKYFEGFGDFTGEVISYDVYSGYFKVEYTDGDREDVDLIELSEIIVAEEFIGRAVWKNFEGFGYFEGEVLSYDEDSTYFTVEYSDGDREELDLTELVEILVAVETAEFAPGSVGIGGRKRNLT